MKKTIFFDMDGTIANFYGVNNWIFYLTMQSALPYEKAAPLFSMSNFAKTLHKLQKKGYKIGIISWLAPGAGKGYSERITKAKTEWLKQHLPSVEFDEIHIDPYGTPKETYVQSPQDVLFDDNEKIRTAWTGTAYNAENIMETLKRF